MKEEGKIKRDSQLSIHTQRKEEVKKRESWQAAEK
jgi:hypothetical protein